jgi:hypothetical protein
MSSFIPILKDIIPIIMPSEVQVTKSTELDAGIGQTEGMIRKGAIVKKSEHICASGRTPFLTSCILPIPRILTLLAPLAVQSSYHLTVTFLKSYSSSHSRWTFPFYRRFDFHRPFHPWNLTKCSAPSPRVLAGVVAQVKPAIQSM